MAYLHAKHAQFLPVYLLWTCKYAAFRTQFIIYMLLEKKVCVYFPNIDIVSRQQYAVRH